MMCKEEILGRVNTILQQLAEIVSQLSTKESPDVSQECPMWWDANQEVRLQSTVSLDTSDLESLVSSCSNDYRGSEIINSATLSKSPELYYSLIKMDVGNNNISMPSDTTASSPAQVHSSSDPDLSLHNSEENIVTTSSPDDGYSVSSSSDARSNTGSKSDLMINR